MSWFRPRSIVPGLIAALVLVATISLATAPDAYACSCVVPPLPEEALDESDDVFTGEVLDITEIAGGDLSVLFAVTEAWKGVEQQEIEVATAGNSAACGFAFEAGEEYLVYTYENTAGTGPESATGLCQRTAALADAGEDLDALGTGTPGSELAAADTTDDDSDDGEFLGMSAWLLGGGATVVAFALMALRFMRG